MANRPTSPEHTESVIAVVVTYNRCNLLRQCIRCLIQQTSQPARIVIVDNASTDNTQAWIASESSIARNLLDYLRMSSNVGGAGGFAEGMNRAVARGAGWIWIMDDDAEPHADALEELMNVASDPGTIYGSLALSGDEPAWATTSIAPPLGRIFDAGDMPEAAEVAMIPFLGLLVHRSMVERIGLPDAGFFIAGDDAEYCLRAKHLGAKLVIAGRSRIQHPKSASRTFVVFGHNIVHLSLPPWKRYYDVRNRLLIARKYFGIRVLTQTLPGLFFRLFVTLAVEPRKFAQLYSFCTGLVDGLLGLRGKRHTAWGIQQ